MHLMQLLLRTEREREYSEQKRGRTKSNNINHKSSNISWQLQANQTTDKRGRQTNRHIADDRHRHIVSAKLC